MAIATPQVRRPQRHGAGWLVPSASGPGAYYVQVDAHTVRCTCPAWVHRRTQLRGDCKHIRLVQEVLMAD